MRYVLAILILLLAVPAYAQFGGGVSTQGSVAPNDLASFVNAYTIRDSGVSVGTNGILPVANGGTGIGTTATLVYPTDSVTAYGNIGLGYGALVSVGTGTNNSAFGYLAGNSVTTGYNNVLFGWEAGSSITTGHWNDCIGHDACEHLVSGIQETAVGEGALFNDTSGGQVAVGFDALLANTTGANNTALGANTLANNLSGQNNVAVGNSAGLHILGSSDTAIGAGAMQAETGSNETGVGYNALTLATGGNNTAFGNGAGSSITSGSNNLILGLNAASSTLTTGQKNILIGGYNGGGLDTPLSSTSNFLDIGNTIFGTNVNTGTLASPAGTIGIGTATVSTSNALEVNGAATIGYPDIAAQSNGLNVKGGVAVGTTGTWIYGAQALVDGGSTNNGLVTYTNASGAASSTISVGSSATNLQAYIYQPNGIGNAYTLLSLIYTNGTVLEQNGTIDFTGNIGIGTTTVTNSLDINGAASIGYAGIAAPTNGLIVSGAVGLGTTILNSYELNIVQSGGNQMYVGSIGANQSVVNIDTKTTGNQSAVNFLDAGTVDWIVGKNPSKNFIITDNSTTHTAIGIALGGDVTLGEAQNVYVKVTTGYVGIATATPQAPLAVYGLASGAITSDYLCYDTTDGRFTYQTSNCTASLRELKDNIRPYTTGLADALALKPSTFFMKNEHELGEEIGLIAQDTASVNRDLAVYQDGKLRSVQYDRMGVVAIAAIRDINKMVEDQQREINSLREQLHVPKPYCNSFCQAREWLESL